MAAFGKSRTSGVTTCDTAEVRYIQVRSSDGSIDYYEVLRSYQGSTEFIHEYAAGQDGTLVVNRTDEYPLLAGYAEPSTSEVARYQPHGWISVRLVEERD